METFDGSERHEPVMPEPPLSVKSWLMRNGPYLVIAALILYFLFKLNFLVVLLVALGLGLVIFIHELGHFLVAKWCDVHVETFSIGFGPALPGCSFRRGETTYMIALFPLGGYVKMVGEGPDSEESEDDPRSFKNKPVWQRVAIISAGVVMNVILGCACFVVAYLHGVKQQPAVVGQVDAGSAIWEKGVPSGVIIDRIGQARNPFFEDLRPEVMLSWRGQSLPFVYHEPGGPQHEIDIVPRREENSTHPVIGVAPPRELHLFDKSADDDHLPWLRESPANHAEPPFEFGDEVVGTTDPEHVNEVTPLHADPRNTQREEPDYFEFERRMARLAGRPVVMRVNRGGSPVDVHVPAAYHWVFPGMRVRIGKVASIRENSPAEKAGVAKGDILQKIEIRDAEGKRLKLLNVDELDPLRLPFEVQQAVGKTPGRKQVTLTVLKPNEAKGASLPPVPYEDGWQDDLEVPSAPTSPLPIPGLGVAYLVETTVIDVKAGSAAEQAGLRKDDVIREIRLLKDPGTSKDEDRWGPWTKLWSRRDGEEVYEPWWAHIFWILHTETDYKEVQVRVKRDKTQLDEPITLRAEEDKTWPLRYRGLLFMTDWRWQKADNLGEAMGLGMHKTANFIKQVYFHLVSIMTRRVSPEMLGGPITIARAAYKIAGSDFYEFLLFLGIISVNLAVINFLPIPVLDGGHIVFLIYEKLRGKPASEQVRAAATYVGLALILCLMVFVLYLDVKRL